MIVCWSPKGGSGSTVVSTVLALEFSRLSSPTLLVDISGDASVVLGIDTTTKLGTSDWLCSSSDVPLDSLRRLPQEVDSGLTLLGPGRAIDAPCEPRQVSRLRDAFRASTVVVDAGTSPLATSFVDVSAVSIMVLRSCFLAVRRASTQRLHADGFVLIAEDGRSLDAGDIEDVTGVAHYATIGWDASVARLVDAGRMKSRLPKSLKPLARLANSLSEKDMRSETDMRNAG